MLAALQELGATTFPLDVRREGILNDERQATDWTPPPLSELAVPVLLVHGSEDRNVPYALSEAAAKAIPHAKLVTIEGGDHTTTLAASQARTAITDFLTGATDR